MEKLKPAGLALVLEAALAFLFVLGSLIPVVSAIEDIVCGDGVCSLGETHLSCPEDCNLFDASLPINRLRVVRGDPLPLALRIHQIFPQLAEYRFSVSPELEDYVFFEQESFVFEEGGQFFLPLSVYVESGDFVTEILGDIVIETRNQVLEIPVFVEVLAQGSKMISVTPEALSESVNLGDELIYFLIINFHVDRKVDAQVSVSIQNVESYRVYTLDYFNVSPPHFRAIRSITMNKSYFGNLSESEILGAYNLIVDVDYDGYTVQGMSMFQLTQSFFDTLLFKVVVFSAIGFFVFFLVFKAVKKYLAYKWSKVRYIKPKFRDLPWPKDEAVYFKVGKVADTSRPAYVFAPDLTTHALVAGSTGSGKSVSASIIAEEALNNKIPVVAFDPTSQWTGFLSALRDRKILKYYPKFGLSEDDTRSYKGLIFTPKDMNFDIDIKDYLVPGEITIFNLAHLSTREYDLVVAKLIDALFKQSWDESFELKLLVVFDEVHRLLNPACSGAGYAALTRGAREFRKWGIGLLMASQVSSDFKEAIGGNVLTEFQLNTKNLNDIKKISNKYGEEFAARVTRQGIGVALVQNAKYNNGRPWFINFRPPLHNPHKLSEEDLDAYNKFTAKLKKIRLKIEELKSQGANVSDFELDHGLANSKLKEGKFKMVEIYLQSLEERLKI